MGRVLRVMLIVLVVLGWVPLGAVTVGRLIGGDRTPFLQLASFAPVAAVGWLVAVLLLVVVRAWRWAVLPLAALVLHLFWLGQPLALALRAGDPPVGQPLSVLTVNTQYGGADAGAVAALVAENQVDLVAVQEMTPDFASRFDPAVRERLPYRVIQAEPGSAAGSGIWSRWPVKDLGSLPMGFHNAQGDVEVPNVGTVRVTSVHTQSPMPQRVEAWRRDYGVLARQARSGGAQIMLGDFNATRDHRPFRNLLDGLDDADEQVTKAPWANQTWPMGLRRVPPAVRIDHVLVPEGTGVTSTRIADVPGTDHRAVLARLVMRAT